MRLHTLDGNLSHVYDHWNRAGCVNGSITNGAHTRMKLELMDVSCAHFASNSLLERILRCITYDYNKNNARIHRIFMRVVLLSPIRFTSTFLIDISDRAAGSLTQNCNQIHSAIATRLDFWPFYLMFLCCLYHRHRQLFNLRFSHFRARRTLRNKNCIYFDAFPYCISTFLRRITSERLINTISCGCVERRTNS